MLHAAVMTTMSCGAVYKLSAVACPRIWPSYNKLKPPQQRDWDSRVPSTFHAIAITAATAYALGMTSVFQRNRLDKVCAVPRSSLCSVQPSGRQDVNDTEY